MDAASALRWGVSVLREAGVEDAPLSAVLLLAHAMGVKKERVYIEAGREVDPARLSRYRELLDKRCSREPLQYITGSREFYGLDFIVRAGVLVPRPETEILVERALELLRSHVTSDRPCFIADVGTGSGAIAVSVAKNMLEQGIKRECLRVYATDVSSVALDVARENITRHGLGDIVFPVQGDLLTPLLTVIPLDGFAAILSNPPYIPSDEIDTLADEVRLFEPRQALDGGPDGKDFYKRLAAQALPLLQDCGALVLEIGQGQAGAVIELLRSAGFTRTGVTADLAGIDRVVCGMKPGGSRC